MAVRQCDESMRAPRFTGLGIRPEWGGDQFMEEMRLPLHELGAAGERRI